MPEALRCATCSAPLPPGADRCAECGAPVGAAPRSPPSTTTKLAAWLLLSLFVLSIVQSVSVIADPSSSIVGVGGFGGGSFAVDGRVVDENGTSLESVRVAVSGDPNQTAITDADGSFRLPAVPAGVTHLQIDRGGYATVILRLFLLHEETLQVTLTSQSEGLLIVEHGSFRSLKIITQTCGAILLGFGFLMVAGALAAYRRRNWGLALAGAIVGLTASIPLSLLLGAIAIVLVVRGRSEFRR